MFFSVFFFFLQSSPSPPLFFLSVLSARSAPSSQRLCCYDESMEWPESFAFPRLMALKCKEQWLICVKNSDVWKFKVSCTIKPIKYLFPECALCDIGTNFWKTGMILALVSCSLCARRIGILRWEKRAYAWNGGSACPFSAGILAACQGLHR